MVINAYVSVNRDWLLVENGIIGMALNESKAIGLPIIRQFAGSWVWLKGEKDNKN